MNVYLWTRNSMKKEREVDLWENRLCYRELCRMWERAFYLWACVVLFSQDGYRGGSLLCTGYGDEYIHYKGRKRNQ